MSRLSIIKRLAVVTFVLFLGVNYIAYFEIEAYSLGGRLLDLRPLGYLPAEVQQFSLGLSFEARRSYTDAFLILDVVFIGFLFALLACVAGWLKPKKFWWAIALFAAGYAIADLVENYLVYQIVWGDVSRAELTSLATRIKFASLLLAAAAVITCWRQEDQR